MGFNSHTGASGQTHWGVEQGCKSCRDYETRRNKKRNGQPNTNAFPTAEDHQAAYDALPDIIVRDTSTLAIARVTARIVEGVKRFVLRGSYRTGIMFSKEPPTFTALKVVSRDLKSVNGGRFQFDAPKADGTPGDWASIDDAMNIVLCERGFHFTDFDHFPSWVTQALDRVFVVEIEGSFMGDSEKYVARKMRLVRELDRAQLVVLHEQLIGNRMYAPTVQRSEVVDLVPDIADALWNPELITSQHPLLVALRSAIENKDRLAVTNATIAVETEQQVMKLQIEIARLRQEPIDDLVTSLTSLLIPDGARIDLKPGVDTALSKISKIRYPDDRTAQSIEFERLLNVIDLAVNVEKLSRWLKSREEQEDASPLDALSIVRPPNSWE